MIRSFTTVLKTVCEREVQYMLQCLVSAPVRTKHVFESNVLIAWRLDLEVIIKCSCIVVYFHFNTLIEPTVRNAQIQIK